MRIRNILLLLIALAGPLQAQTVRLLPHATVSSPIVQLGAIAQIEDLSDTQAEALSETVILPNLAGSRTLKPEDILCVLVAGGQRDLALKLQVCGAASCEVTLEDPSANARAIAPLTADHPASANRALTADVMQPSHSSPKPSAPEEPAKPTGVTVQTTTLAQLLQAQVYSELLAAPDDIRITFETVHPLLDQPVPVTQRWQYRPLVKVFLGTVQWQAQLMEGHQMLQRLNVQAKILKRIHAVAALAPIQNGDIITPDKIALEEHWVDRKIDTQFTRIQDVLGQQAVRPLIAGSSLDQRDFRPLELIARGDVATVYYISGALKIKTSARALENGKLHDHITLRNEKTGEKLDATVIAKGVAAIGNLDAKTEQSLRESQ